MTYSKAYSIILSKALEQMQVKKKKKKALNRLSTKEIWAVGS